MSTRTLKDLATEALEIQNASDLCELAQRFAKVMLDLGEHTKSADERNKHPIVSLWLDKFDLLADMPVGDLQRLNGDYELVSKWSQQ